MTFTSAELLLLLHALHPGSGYSEKAEVAQLQAKLSIMLAVARKREEA